LGFIFIDIVCYANRCPVIEDWDKVTY